MEISRRDFLKYVGSSAVALYLASLPLEKIEQALAASDSPAVIWLHGSNCTGCSVSLLNAVNPTIDSVLLNTISLKYHPTLMAAAGDMAVTAARSTQAAGNYVLVVEGAIPTANGGKYCFVWDENGKSVTMAEAVTSLAAKAKAIVAVGTCAAFGGIPAVACEPSAKSVGTFLNRKVINLSGCPAHPDWIIGALAQLIAGANIPLDANNRPTAFYTSQVIHERCPRREA